MTETPVGASVAGEAGRLLAALEEWVRSGGLSQGLGDHIGAGLAGGLGWVGGNVGGSQECRLCPVCQLLAVLRGTQPETWAHLQAALGNLADALRSVLESGGQSGGSGAPVQHIHVR